MKSLIKKLLVEYLLTEDDDDYRMDHTAPDKTSGVPIYDISDYYPDDIFGPKGVRYYGHGVPYDNLAISILRQVKGKPNAAVKIYRSVPTTLSNVDKITHYQTHQKYIAKTGKLPKGVDNWSNSAEYNDYLSNEIDRLSNLPDDSETKYTINPGDWVTTVLQYAKDHGKSHIGKFKILSKTVPAKHVYTQGDSIHEYGYDPT
jgi:hypothetical protein